MSCNSYFIATHGNVFIDGAGNPITQKLNPVVLSKFKGKVYFVTFTEPGGLTDIEDRRLLTYYMAVHGTEFVEEFTEFMNWLQGENDDVLKARIYLSSVHFRSIYKYADQILNVINSTVRKDSSGAEYTRSIINVYTKKNLPYNMIMINSVIGEEYFVMPVDEARTYGFDTTSPLTVRDSAIGATRTDRVSNILQSRANPDIKYVGGINSISARRSTRIVPFMTGENLEWSRRAFVDSPVKMKIPMVVYHVCDKPLTRIRIDPNLTNVTFGNGSSCMYIDNRIQTMINTPDSPMQTLENYILSLTDGMQDIYNDVYFIMPSCQDVRYVQTSPGGSHYTVGASIPSSIVSTAITPQVVPSRFTRGVRGEKYLVPRTLTSGIPTTRPSIRVQSRRHPGSTPTPGYTGRIIEITYDYDSITASPDIISMLRMFMATCFGGYVWNPTPSFGVVTFYKRRGTRGSPDFVFEYSKSRDSYHIFSVCASHLIGQTHTRIPHFVSECMKSWIRNHQDGRGIFLGVDSNQPIDKFKRLIRLYKNVGFFMMDILCTVGPSTYSRPQVVMKYGQTTDPGRIDMSDAHLDALYNHCQTLTCTAPAGFNPAGLEPIVISHTPAIIDPAIQTYPGPLPPQPEIISALPSPLTPFRRPSTIVSGRAPAPYVPYVPGAADDDMTITQGGWSI